MALMFPKAKVPKVNKYENVTIEGKNPVWAILSDKTGFASIDLPEGYKLGKCEQFRDKIIINIKKVV